MLRTRYEFHARMEMSRKLSKGMEIRSIVDGIKSAGYHQRNEIKTIHGSRPTSLLISIALLRKPGYANATAKAIRL